MSIVDCQDYFVQKEGWLSVDIVYGHAAHWAQHDHPCPWNKYRYIIRECKYVKRIPFQPKLQIWKMCINLDTALFQRHLKLLEIRSRCKCTASIDVRVDGYWQVIMLVIVTSYRLVNLFPKIPISTFCLISSTCWGGWRFLYVLN